MRGRYPPKAAQSKLTWGEGGGGGVLKVIVISVPFLGNLIVEKFQINTLVVHLSGIHSHQHCYGRFFFM